MPERKKSLVPKGPETPVAMENLFAEATGALDPEVAMHLAQQAISALSLCMEVRPDLAHRRATRMH